VAERVTGTVNKHLASLQDFYVWRGLGQPRASSVTRCPAAHPRRSTPGRSSATCGPWRRGRAPGPGYRLAAAVRRPAHRRGRGPRRRRRELQRRKGKLHVVGKGEKSRTVPVPAILREALAAWLAERPGQRGAETAALFTSGRGTRLTTDAIADVLAAITTAAGMDDHVS
jgi:integrase